MAAEIDWRMHEWLETDGLGGFAMGTAGLIRTRRYHALLLAAEQPPAGRAVLVNGLEMWVQQQPGPDAPWIALSSQHYAPDVQYPDGATRIDAFTHTPWPTWTFSVPGARLRFELAMRHGRPEIFLRWTVLSGHASTLIVRPLLSGRDFHNLMRANDATSAEAQRLAHGVAWRPSSDHRTVRALCNADYVHDPAWFRDFLYAEEQARGLDCIEDLISPGLLRFELGGAPACLLLSADPTAADADAAVSVPAAFAAEAGRRAAFADPLHRAADAYVVRRPGAGGAAGHTIIAGYPWFGDWGRDSFISLPGLCLETGRGDIALDILRTWARHLHDGLLPNHFPDNAGPPAYNSVDAALWYVLAVAETLRRAQPTEADTTLLRGAVCAILDAIAAGSAEGVRLDDDGLVAAGLPGQQLTWMDAKVGDWVVTPRRGKPVEIQALWFAALAHAATWEPRFAALRERGVASFLARFRDAGHAHLADVVDVEGQAGAIDWSLRPNQVFALGAIGPSLLDTAGTRRALDAVEQALLTPLGLRTLAPGDPSYQGRYGGGVRERDGAYHQGTVWPWLLAPFAAAWIAAHGNDDVARRAAADRFLPPLRAHLAVAGLGHVSEVLDGDAPHRPGGCPFQAWSVAAILRLSAMTRATKR